MTSDQPSTVQWDHPGVAAWEARGRIHELDGHRIFALDLPAGGDHSAEPLLVIHGYPTSSFDFAAVAPSLAAHRRVVLVDLLGFGCRQNPISTTRWPAKPASSRRSPPTSASTGSRCSPMTWATPSAGNCWPVSRRARGRST